MKKWVPLLMITFCTGVFAQGTFEFSKSDSVPMSKDKLYSQTKMFISDTWKSSKSVIQNDDKDGGVIQIKGRLVKYFKGALGAEIKSYEYEYSVKFLQKNNKYKVVIYDIRCVNAEMDRAGNIRTIPLIQPFDSIPSDKTSSFFSGGISKNKAIEMMSSIKKSMNEILSEYSIFLAKNKDDF